MLNSAVIEDTNIVTATYSGSLSTDEMSDLRRRIDSVIAEHGSAKLLIEYGNIDVSRIEPRAMWEDLKTTGALNHVDKIAIVTDAVWVQKASQITGALIPAEVQAYETGQRDRALLWLRSERQ